MCNSWTARHHPVRIFPFVQLLISVATSSRVPRRSLVALRSMVHDALAKFDKIYDLQLEGRVFDTPEELWGEFFLSCYCRAHGFSVRLVEECGSFKPTRWSPEKKGVNYRHR